MFSLSPYGAFCVPFPVMLGRFLYVMFGRPASESTGLRGANTAGDKGHDQPIEYLYAPIIALLPRHACRGWAERAAAGGTRRSHGARRCAELNMIYLHDI